MADELMNQEGNVFGEWRKAVNAAASMVHSIHDDSVGKKVGMRGGVVAGTMHLDLFPPVLLKTFGQKSFEQGAISLFFTYALLDGEEVRVIMQPPPESETDVIVETRPKTGIVWPGGHCQWAIKKRHHTFKPWN